MKVFEELLEKYWILKEDNEELYYEIKDSIPDIKEFLKNKFGYKIIVTPVVIKLEKIPGVPCSFFGINEFSKKEEYVLLCIILMFLEDKAPNEQFILSGLVDYIKSTVLMLDVLDIEIDFTMFQHRKMMVNVLRFISIMKFIKKYDGDESKFIEEESSEVLYEVTGFSRYFMRNFSNDIQKYTSYLDILNGENLGLQQDRGDERRHRIYRRIFMEPIVYKDLGDNLDYLYIKNYKNIIENDVENMLDSKFIVNKNGAYILLDETKGFKDVFPNTKAISDIVLFLSTEIIQKVHDDKLKLNVDGYINISHIDLHHIILECKEKYQVGFSVEYRTMEDSKFIYEIKEYLKSISMLDENMDEYIILPLMFRMCGKFPERFELE